MTIADCGCKASNQTNNQKQSLLYCHKRFQIWKYMDCTINEAKTKALISCTLTVQMICALSPLHRFAHDAAQVLLH